MEPKLRVFELAKSLQVDSKAIMEVLQTLNVDVKNHMSTLDQDTADKVSEAVKRTAAKKSTAGAAKASAKTAKPAEAPKPAAREANPAKASLLEDFFGAGTKPRQRVEDMKRELRPADHQVADRPGTERPAAAAERPPQERRPLVERPRLTGLATSGAERPAATSGAERPASRPAAERPAARPAAERPATQRPAAERPAARPAAERPATPRPAAERPAADRPTPAAERRVPAERPAAVEAERPAAPALPAGPAAAEKPAKAERAPKAPRAEKVAAPAAEPVAPVDQAPPEPVTAPAPVAEAPEAHDAPDPVAEAPDFDDANGEPARPAALPTGPAAMRSALPAGPAAMRPSTVGTPRPAGTAPASGLGMPSRPVPGGPAAGGPMPRGMGAGPVSSGPSGLGMPAKPVPGAPTGRPGFGPRPGGFGDRPARPGMGGGPRPGGMGGARPGFGGPGRGRGGVLNIPKVDPKVAEAAKPGGEAKRPIGQGGDRKKGDAFTKRENQASRPSEEKLFGRGRRGVGKASIVERRSLRPITLEGAMTVKDLAHEMGVTAGEVIKKLLTGFGIMATINQELDVDTCVLVAGEFGVDASVKAVQDVVEEYDKVAEENEDKELKEPRNPVVTIMGHVDHGKTSLLDALRSAKVAAGEAGGITQHIGAYEVEMNGRKITFLDTPGHEAFTAMRARGANVTDIAILVVAADDSVMPQTIESINHAKAAGVPVLVAVNKIDKPGANPDKVKQDLTAHGLVAEEWGGETIMVPVSAKMHTNLDLLLENVLLLAEVQDLKANPNKDARGTILEAELDKARGPVATVLVQEGTLNNGDSFVAGSAWGKVRAMFDHRGKKLKTAGPSTPVRVLGFNSVPAAGDVFRVAPDEKLARGVAEKRQNRAQAERQGTKAMSLDEFMSAVEKGEVKDLNLIVKADVQGSVEALRGQLEKLENAEVQVKVIHSAVGAITETDVMLAATSMAIIIGFNVRPDDRAARAASDQGIDMRLYDVIYNVVDDIKAAMTGMLAPKIEENVLGRAEVREVFKVPKVGMAAGCMVTSGKVTRNAKYRLIRDGVVVWGGEVNALRRFKDEVRDVAEGYECGITLEKYQDFKPGDILEAYELKEVKAVG